jgi:TetR/AcrR family transcriptional repressor of nem operon
MARPREFDETAVLAAATDLFWTRGFESTTTRDLADAMGLTVASLYNAYGDKRSLYRLVLDRYAANALAWCGSTLEEGPTALKALERFFQAIGRESLSNEAQRGCLVVNAGLQTAPQDAELGEVVAQVFERIDALLAACVARGQAEGSIAPTQSAEEVASLLLGVMLGLRVVARTKPDASLVHGMVHAATATLRPHP